MLTLFKIFFSLFAVIIGVYCSLLIYLYFNQKSIVFFPNFDFVVTPEQLGLEYEEVVLNINKTDSVHGWFFPSKISNDSTNKKVVLFCHGNAGNISYRLETANMIIEQGADFLLFDYRGYGKSVGELSEENVYQDARLCYDWLINEKKYKSEEIIIFGRSLGGAVAVDLATKVNCAGLIIESTFTSTGDLGRAMFPLFPTGLLIRYKFDSYSKIDKVNTPILVIHSQQDSMIPFYMGVYLYEKANEPKAFFKIKGDHNDRSYLGDVEYLKYIKDLIYSN